jgi:hypothetical protein
MLSSALNERSRTRIPASQNWPLLSDTEVVDDGFEVLSVGLGDVGGVGERLVTNALTTDVIPDLLRVR